MSEAAETRRAILDLLYRDDYRPATIRSLIRLLGVDRTGRNAFKRVLREMVAEEAVVKVGGIRYAAPGGDHGSDESGGRSGPVVNGLLQINRRGFGFVTPDGGGRDIFIPPHAVRDLMPGDRVAVRIGRPQPDGRVRGARVRLLERSKRPIVGIYRGQGSVNGPGMVEAYDRRFAAGIQIPEGEVGKARNGQVVGVEMTRGQGAGRWPLGRIVEVLGSPDDPGMDLKTIVRKYDLREEFPPEALAAADRIAEQVPASEIVKREDFRDLPIVTIDGETARDFDDAVLVRRNDDGTYELQVHIADVAHYVPAAGPLDKEAYQRGTSVYFPGTAIPMLPEALSNGICSLNPGVDRLVQSCLMTIDRHGRVVSQRFAQGVIRSAARMTYTRVAKILVDGDPDLSEEYGALVPMFRLMEELCGILNAKRRRRGSIDFDLPEPEIILAVTGEMTGIVALERNIAHRLIEEFMLIANETVARHLWRAHIPSLYRIHERPDPRRLEEFDTVAQAFGYRLQKPYTRIEPAAFQAMIDMAQGQPEERFLARQMLRSMKQARYSERRDIHFGLASRYYTHFTSPIRRYPDLVVHRLLKRQLSGEALPGADKKALADFLPAAAAHSSQTERNADAAENELVEWKKMAFMADRLGEEFDGFIVSVHQFGFFVELREYFVDGLVSVESLHDDHYRFIERKQLLQGEARGRVFKLGDPVRVRVDRVNHFLLQLDFSLIEPNLGEGRVAAPGRVRRKAVVKSGVRSGARMAGQRSRSGEKARAGGKRAAPRSTGAKRAGAKRTGAKRSAKGKTGAPRRGRRGK